MNTSKLSSALKSVQRAMKRHSPEILTGIGIAGMITTTVMACRATPKALALIKDAEYEKGDLHDDGNCIVRGSLTPIETVKAAWTCYIPSAIVGLCSVGCLIGASSVNLRRNAALAAAYALSEDALKEYQAKVVEEVGEKKASEIRDHIAQDKLDQKPVSTSEVIITQKGDTLCFDVISGRYFKSDIEKLRKIVNELNRRMRDEIFISLNEFYYEIGLEGIKIGDDLGWDIDRGYVDLDFRTQLADDGTPCLVVDYRVAPEYRQ